MAKDQMDYNQMVSDALRGVVKSCLERTVEHGLGGGHHFYITFNTLDPLVEISDFLREKHPEEMTIVMQYQFWDLTVEKEHFEVTLSFNKVHERLVIPFRALTGFFDPSVQFGLQFEAYKSDETTLRLSLQSDDPEDKEILDTVLDEAGNPLQDDAPKGAEAEDGDDDADDADVPKAALKGDGKVVTLDSFRKK